MIRIGSLEVDLDRRQLLRNGVPLNVGSRAFDVLAVLIEARGELVSKDALINQVWPRTIVQENNLHVQLTSLRHLLGEHRALLQTISGRGYRLAGTLEYDTKAASAVAIEDGRCEAARVPPSLPASATEIIGREDAIDDIVRALGKNRHVSLVGAGGIGKTRLAVEVANRIGNAFPDGVYFIPLASASDPDSVRLAASRALGLNPGQGPVSFAQFGREIGHPRMLFVLDNCEQVIGAASTVAEALGGISEGARVMATSREPLRVIGEDVYRVEPLHVLPLDDFEDTAVRCSAVQLFFSRARAIDPLFPSNERVHALIHTICRRLDGIPLAIELAAARATILGVDALAARLDDRFKVLTGGTSFALPRHQTLKATFDWSYALLSETERTTLRRLSVFASGFTMPAAVAVVAHGTLDEYAVTGAVTRLVEKSLVVRPGSGNKAAYRLLETTRAYAQQKLNDNGEQHGARSSHASYLISLLDDTVDACVNHDSETWERDMRERLDDLRAAMTWGLSPQGDNEIAEALSVRFVRLLFELSLLDECASWARRAIQVLHDAHDIDSPRARRARMQLQAALAAALVYLQGPNHATRAIWSDVLSSAIEFDDPPLEARALWGLWNASQSAGDARSAVAFARRFAALPGQAPRALSVNVQGDSADEMLGHRLMGIALHYAGEQQASHAALQQFMPLSRSLRFTMPLGRTIDQHVVGSATLARVLWLKGQRDEALQLAARCTNDACRGEQAVVACYVLVEAGIPIALLSGERACAANAIDRLSDISSRAGLTIARACSRVFRACLTSLDHGDAEHLGEFSEALSSLDALGFGAPAAMLAAYYALSLGRAGRYDEAIKAVTHALKRCEEKGDRWFAAELFRIRGELLLGESDSSTEPAVTAVVADVEHALVTALDTSTRQGAASLQLRAATSLARFWVRQGHIMRALTVLDAAMSLFPARRDWPDYIEAASLLDSIQDTNTSRVRCAAASEVDDADSVVGRDAHGTGRIAIPFVMNERTGAMRRASSERAFESD
ncbi:ATP-binding protein [Pararobbsia alpina]|uniref:ATP-binding protein n=1 Tax=Pararobbsia alpina TaxID=621374 RepID=UPI0039A75BF2